jgi:hypothetical protein
MSGDATFIAELVASLQTDTGAGSLVDITGHTTQDKRILRGYPPKNGNFPFLGVIPPSSVPLAKDTTFVKRYYVSIAAFSGKDHIAIQLADRVEFLFHKLSGAANGYYNFTSSNIIVYSTRWRSRIRAQKDDDIDYYKDENMIEVVANPFRGI